MLIANFVETFYNELIDFFGDIKYTFLDTVSYFHNLLNRYISDDILIVFLIAIGAFLLILIFRYIINKD